MPEFKSLVDGYRRFRAGDYQVQRQRWEALAEGQAPPVMVIGCCDSRVDPGIIFDTRPGEVFILRNVANLVPPSKSAAGATARRRRSSSRSSISRSGTSSCSATVPAAASRRH
jgi:carbonic anhydrase